MLGVEPIRPAYGRVYTTVAQIQKDFDDGKDFQIDSGSYATKEELRKHGFTGQIEARYGDKQQHKAFLLCTIK